MAAKSRFYLPSNPLALGPLVPGKCNAPKSTRKRKGGGRCSQEPLEGRARCVQHRGIILPEDSPS